MFLRSEAFRALTAKHAPQWDWRSTSILLISYDWDPTCGGPEALAGRRLAARLLDVGARVHVLSGRGAGRTSDYPSGSETFIQPEQVSNNRLFRAWQMIQSGVPEPQCLWVQEAVDAGVRVLSSLPGDTIIYSRAMPGSSNIVAWYLAKRTGRPWVAHFSDEWPPVQALENGRAWLVPYKVPLFELWRRRFVRDAHALTFTNPRLAAAVLGRTAERHASKAFVVTHLPSQPRSPRPPQQGDLFHIVHTGNFNPPGHSPRVLMKGIRLFLDRTPAALGRVVMTQAGWANGDLPEWTKQCGLEDVVRIVGRLQQPELLELVDSASLLVGFDYSRPDSATLLSKLPDYVSSCRPILVMTAPTSAMGCLFREDGVGLTAHYDSPEEVAECVARVFDAWQRREFQALLPQSIALESFADRTVLSELAGAFAVAREAISEDSRRPALLG